MTSRRIEGDSLLGARRGSSSRLPTTRTGGCQAVGTPQCCEGDPLIPETTSLPLLSDDEMFSVLKNSGHIQREEFPYEKIIPETKHEED